MSKILVILVISTISVYGQQWVENNVLPGNYYVCDVNFINSNTGYVAMQAGGYPPAIKVLKTINKGVSWQELWSGSSTNSEMQKTGVYFINENTGFVFYDDKLLKSTNGWHNVLQLPESHGRNYSILFVNEQTGYALYSQGNRNTYPAIEPKSAIYKTTNSGDSWFVVNAWQLDPNYYDLIDLQSADFSKQNANIIFICGTMRHAGSAYDVPVIWSTYNGFSTDVNIYSVNEQENVTMASYINVLPNTTDDVVMLCDKGVYRRSGAEFVRINALINSIYTPQAGLCFSTGTLGFAGTLNAVTGVRALYSTSDGGYNWNLENSSSNINISGIKSFVDVAYKGGSNGVFLTREIYGNFNTSFDWQAGTAGSITLDGNPYSTSNAHYYRGGYCILSTAPFIISGNDTTADFYYWGGALNGSMNANSSTQYIVTKDMNINAYYKTKLKTTTPEPFKYSPQVKTIKDTNGVTNLVNESMEGIFFTRTKPDGSFKCEEIVSGTSQGNIGYATFKNTNPYISETKAWAGGQNEADREHNMAVVWERREGNDIKILWAGRAYMNYQFYWVTRVVKTISNAPEGYKCFPKIVQAHDGYYNADRYVVTYLNPVGTASAICAFYCVDDVFYPTQTLVSAGDISDYSVAHIFSWNNSQSFDLHIAYKQSNKIYYQHHRYTPPPGNSWNHLSEDKEISGNEIQSYRNTPDISLRNASLNQNVINMQPVVSYQGQYQTRIAIQIQEQGDGFQYVNNTYYPIIIRERLANGTWALENLQYNSQIQQQNPNIEGSKTRNSYMVNYSRNYNTFYQQIPRWEGTTSSGMVCDPGIYSGTDAKFVKGGLVNQNTYYQSLTTLSPSGSIFAVGKQDFTIENIAEGDGIYNGVNGIAVVDNMQYSFNLGSIMINGNMVYFDSDIDTSNNGSLQEELNDNMRSRNFYVSDNDTLVLGRNAFYQPTDSSSSFTDIRYTVDLVSSSTDRVFQTLTSDTIHAEDTVHIRISGRLGYCRH